MDSFKSKQLSNQSLKDYFNLKKNNDELSHYTSQKISVMSQLNNHIDDVVTINNKKINVYKVNNNNLFETFISLFYFDSILIANHGYLLNLKVKHCFLTIDFEKDIKKNMLMQLYFNHFKQNWIFIINPHDFSNELVSLFTKNILENKYIFKLMHGSDSLDIPFINSYFCKNSKISFSNFILHTYDTLLPCEYVTTYGNIINKQNNKVSCSLYNALLNFKVIDEKQYEYLSHLSDSMGEIWKINWNIHHLTSSQLKYSYYDVCYLRPLYKNIILESKKINVLIGIKFIADIYKLIWLSKTQCSDIVDTIKKENDDMNNYIIHEKKTMNDYYDNIMLNYTLEGGLLLNVFAAINYIKKTCIALFKKIIYSQLSQKYVIYINKKDKLDKMISYEELFKELEKLKLKHIVVVLKNMTKEL